LIVDAHTERIICFAQAKGSTHDFKLFKDSYKGILSKIRIMADSGYQGISDIHANSDVPRKKSKKHPLTKEEKQSNKLLSKERILIEHINRRIKRFKILSHRYRNKRRNHALRVSLICAIHNFEIS